MSRRVFNFTAGPSMQPLPVLKRAQEEWLDFADLGASVVEISHLTPEFKAIVNEVEQLLRELLAIPKNYRVTLAHGGGALQFSMVPLNLIALKPARKALYVNTGYFSMRAAEEAAKYGTVVEVATGKATDFDRIPDFDRSWLDGEASYLHITTNNTMRGTRWQTFPQTDGIALVGDATSELLSRPMDISRFGVLYAGAQKNMGTSGLSVAIVREDLLHHALPITPKMINYGQLARDRSLTNTVNTFSIYMARLVLEWIKTSGGLAVIEAQNERKAALVYDALDRHPGFYRPHAQPAHRSRMNVTFKTPSPELDDAFVKEGAAEGLYALRGHRFFGGMRASIYNGMPEEGARALGNFIDEFVRRHG